MATILITRPEPGASETARRLTALGYDPLVAPVLSIQPLGTLTRLPARVSATLLTSRNAVPACPASCYAMPVFAVGEATAAHAKQAGFRHVITAGGDAAALAALLAATRTPAQGSLFLPTARGQGLELTATLRRHGFRVIRHVAYAALPVPALPNDALHKLRQNRVDAVLFFSAETARQFVRLIQTAKMGETVREARAVSISARAIVALRELPWRHICVAEKPNQEAMLALLK